MPFGAQVWALAATCTGFHASLDEPSKAVKGGEFPPHWKRSSIGIWLRIFMGSFAPVPRRFSGSKTENEGPLKYILRRTSGYPGYDQPRHLIKCFLK